jgi:hypothetical protein
MARPLPVEWRNDHIPQELLELRSHLDKLPAPLRDKLLPLWERAGHHSRLQTKIVQIAQDAVDQLQLDMKYLSYDLEVTRRERDELKEILDSFEEEE